MSQVYFPKMLRVRQRFERPQVKDISTAVIKELDSLRGGILKGKTVGITVGSRGIKNITVILAEIAHYIKACGATPVLLAAMGSHGGGTEAGQRDVLASLGIVEESLGARLITCAESREVGCTSKGRRAYMLESAFAVDAILPVNRVKTHTSFKGSVESGLAKMLVVGLGGPPGATQFHAVGKSELLSPLLEDVTRVILDKMPVIGGLTIIENAYEETARIEAVPASKIIERERELLVYSKSLMPSLPSEYLDGLIIEEMGKNFSGTGLDTNIIGRLRIQGGTEPESPVIRYISVLDLSDASHGNATGVGLADFVTQRLVDKIDRKATYLNNLTTTFVTRAFIPMYFPTERETLSTMMHCLRNTPPDKIQLVSIPNTLFLEDCFVSEALRPELEGNSRFEILEGPREMTFDAAGNLLLRVARAGGEQA